MGQATVDLPDPLEQPTAPPSAAADDLLSQLAGDEIDRLLAEAEVERPDPKSRSAPSPVKPPANGGQADASGASQGPDLTEAVADAQADVAAQLDDLFAELNKPLPSPATARQADAQATAPAAEVAGPAPTLAAAAAIAPPETVKEAKLSETLVPSPASPSEAAPTSTTTGANATSPAPTAPPETEVATTSAERDALQAPATVAEPTVAAPSVAEETASLKVAEDQPLPLYLRPLQWINAPFAACPSAVREALGKVAILTLVNALAVLLYVLIFRRH